LDPENKQEGCSQNNKRCKAKKGRMVAQHSRPIIIPKWHDKRNVMFSTYQRIEIQIIQEKRRNKSQSELGTTINISVMLTTKTNYYKCIWWTENGT
jgi:hypothetical protein